MDPRELKRQGTLRALDGIAGDAKRARVGDLLPEEEQQSVNGFLIEIGVRPDPGLADATAIEGAPDPMAAVSPTDEFPLPGAVSPTDEEDELRRRS